MKRIIFLLPRINNDIDAIYLANIFHHKNVTKKIHPHFNDKSIPIISFPTLHILHSKFSIINGYCRTSTLMILRLNRMTVVVKTLHLEMVLPVTSLRGIKTSSKTNLSVMSFINATSTMNYAP